MPVPEPQNSAATKPTLLDAFCCEGGATKGYQRAGFYVVGVDIAPQPNYCGDEFVQGDALRLLADPAFLERFDAIHASPPCQNETTMSNRHRGKGGKADSWPDLIGPTRELLLASGKPWVLENVPGARRKMRNPITLHGGMFGIGVARPRLFDASFFLLAPKAPKVRDPLGVYGKAHDGRRLFTRSDGTIQRAAGSLEEARAAMGMPWASWNGCREAIPPAYTEFIGEQLLAALSLEVSA